MATRKKPFGRCGNCGEYGDIAGKQRCWPCYQWRRRHKAERPNERLIATDSRPSPPGVG